jgi:pSer/pThr/pTyr-binding forkhead associated (FHA) protein
MRVSTGPVTAKKFHHLPGIPCHPAGEDGGFPKKFHGNDAGAALERLLKTRIEAMPRVTITVPGNSPQPYRFQLDRRLVTLGRGSNNDIVIDCASVSVTHAQMCRVEGGYELRDLESTNGIKMDGERRPVIPLRNGMSVHLGDVAFDFQLSDEELETLGQEQPLEESSIVREPVEESDEPHLPPIPASPVRKQGVEIEEADRPGCGSFIWLLILVMTAFIVGMAIRFHRETGDSWLGSVFQRIDIALGGAAPEPAEKPATAPPQGKDASD